MFLENLLNKFEMLKNNIKLYLKQIDRLIYLGH